MLYAHFSFSAQKKHLVTLATITSTLYISYQAYVDIPETDQKNSSARNGMLHIFLLGQCIWYNDLLLWALFPDLWVFLNASEVHNGLLFVLLLGCPARPLYLR